MEFNAQRVRRVFDALSLLRPYDLANGLKLRVGRSGGGGYVLAKQPLPRAIYSFGVGDEISFEVQLAHGGCHGYLFDDSIPGLPHGHPGLQFFREGVSDGSASDLPLARIEDYLRRNGDLGKADLLLKLDLEGREYGVLAATTNATLNSFEQIVVKIHQLSRLADPEFCRAFIAIFERLNGLFTLCHVHANNCAPLVFVEGFPVADVLEMTYVRNDLAEKLPSATVYPTYLDCANDPDRQDINLFFFPFAPLPANLSGTAVKQSFEGSLAALDFEARLQAETLLSPHQRKVSLFGRRLTAPDERRAAIRSIGRPGRFVEGSSRPLNILYFGCHETLEYDDVRMLTEMGHHVFSIGGLSNPDSLKPATRPTMENPLSQFQPTAKFKSSAASRKIHLC